MGITATDARKISEESAWKKGFSEESIDKAIETAALDCEKIIHLDLGKVKYSVRSAVFEKIKAIYSGRGFKVERQTPGYDMRETYSERDSYDRIVISW